MSSGVMKFVFTRTLNPTLVQVVSRDILLVRDDGSIGVIKAGTRLPVYDEKIAVERVPE